MASPIFELTNGPDTGFHFEYFAASGEKLMLSAEFPSKAEAERAIQEVRVGSMMSQMISVGNEPGGNKFFVIKNEAGQVLVKSVLFDSEMLFNNALHAVRDNACVAEVQDKT